MVNNNNSLLMKGSALKFRLMKLWIEVATSKSNKQKKWLKNGLTLDKLLHILTIHILQFK